MLAPYEANMAPYSEKWIQKTNFWYDFEKSKSTAELKTQNLIFFSSQAVMGIFISTDPKQDQQNTRQEYWCITFISVAWEEYYFISKSLSLS